MRHRPRSPRSGEPRHLLALAGVAAVVLTLGAGVVGSARADEVAPAPATGAASAGGRAGRPSGLPWASGAFSHAAERTAAFATARGREVDVLTVFPTRDSWESLANPWWMSPTAVPPGFRGTLAVGLPLFPNDGSMQAAASGADDARWEEMGRLIATRYPDAWVRIGWEMNIPDWPWSVTPGTAAPYRQAFQRAATALKRGGSGLRVVFNPNEGRGGSLPDAREAYPGDEYVDVIAIDAYDWWPAYDAAGWEEHRTKDQGWDFWAAFARDHGKRFAVPEWGVYSGSSASGGDNPAYVTAVLDWMARNADIMDFETYFEETADVCRCALSQNPRAQRAYTDAIARIAAAARAGAPVGEGPAATTAPTAAATTAGEDVAGPVTRRPGRGRFGRDDSTRTLPAG